MPYKFALSGGLGDCIRQCFVHDGYFHLLTPDSGECIIHSHNPFTEELVKWHPAVLNGRCVLTKIPFNPSNHHALDIGAPRVSVETPIFFGADLEKLRLLLPKTPYVILAPDAGDPCKSLPENILLEALRAYDPFLPKVLIGHTQSGSNVWTAHSEMLKDVIDLRNLLNVPETIYAIKNAHHVFTAHSAVNMIAWLWHTAQTVCVPKQLHYELYQSGSYRTQRFDYGHNHTYSRMLIY